MSSAPWARMCATIASRQSMANMTRRKPSVFTGPNRMAPGAWNLSNSMPCPSGGPQHREGGPDILEPDQARNQRPFDGLLALEREAQLDEERLGGFEIVDDDEDV